MSCHRSNNGDQRFRGWSRLQEFRKPLRKAPQQVESAYPYWRLMTAVEGSHDVFPSTSPGKRLGVLWLLHIQHRSGAYAASSWSTPTLELAATRHESDFSNTLPVTAGSCRRPCAHRPLITCRLGRFPSPASLPLTLTSKPYRSPLVSGLRFASAWLVFPMRALSFTSFQ